MKCKSCHRDFISKCGGKFCSKACYQRHSRKHKIPYKVSEMPSFERVCGKCGNGFVSIHSGTKYCSKTCKPIPHATLTRFKIFQRDEFSCAYCGSKAIDGSELHVDHIVAIKNGGPDKASNLITACTRCNLEKGTQFLPDEVRDMYLSVVQRRNKEADISPESDGTRAAALKKL